MGKAEAFAEKCFGRAPYIVSMTRRGRPVQVLLQDARASRLGVLWINGIEHPAYPGFDWLRDTKPVAV